MKFGIDDAKQAEAFTQQIASATFSLTGKQIIEVYKSFAWFNKVCSMIEKDIADGQKSKPEPNGRPRRTRRGASRGDGGDLGNGNQSGIEPSSEPTSPDGL
jgi:hypothetical protein